MHNKDSDLPTSRPLIVSSTSAQQHLAYWLRENNLSQITDQDGLQWSIIVDSEIRPSVTDTHAGDVHLEVNVLVEVTAADLVRSGTLQPEADARLIAMLADARISLRMRPVRHVTGSLEQARLYLSELLPSIRASLSAGNLPDIKRQLVGRWLDQNQQFFD